MISRRSFLGGLICAPAVVRAESLMKIRVPETAAWWLPAGISDHVLMMEEGRPKWVPDFKVVGTTSGRWTSNTPNLSQVPKAGGLILAPVLTHYAR